MRRFPGWTFCLSLVAAAAVVAAGCAPKSPEERVAALRAKYEAELNQFVIKTQPVEPAPAAEEAEEAAASGEEGLAEPAIEELPITSDVVLDIVVKNHNNENLPGLTLDVSQVDAQKQEKGHWRVWVDTAHIGRGPGTALTHVLTGVDYEEGDGFHVEVRQSIPPEEWSEYQEFSSAS